MRNVGQDDKNGSITAKLINSNGNSTIGQSPSSESDMTGTTHIPLQRGIDDCITDHGGQRHSQASLSSVNDRNPDLIPTSSSSSKGRYDFMLTLLYVTDEFLYFCPLFTIRALLV